MAELRAPIIDVKIVGTKGASRGTFSSAERVVGKALLAQSVMKPTHMKRSHI